MNSTNFKTVPLASTGLDENGISAQIDCGGFATVSLQAIFTLSAQYMTLQGSLDGVNFLDIAPVEVLTTGAFLASAHIVASGIYRVNCAGLKLVRLFPHASFAATTGFTVQLQASEASSMHIAAS